MLGWSYKERKVSLAAYKRIKEPRRSRGGGGGGEAERESLTLVKQMKLGKF